MSYNVEFQANLFLISVVWGIIILVIYDIIRVFRRVVKHSNWLIAIEDIIFWIISSLLIFLMLYKRNNGAIRGFAILGMVTGMLLYNMTLSKFLVMYISLIINKVIKVIITCINFILKPIKVFVKFLINVLKKIHKILKKIKKILLKRLKKINKTVRIVFTKK